jgi:hypothetical protein
MEEQLSGFNHGGKWRELVALPEVTYNVRVGVLRAPTVPKNKVCPPRFKFGETFDCKSFTELCEVFKSVNGKLVKDSRGKQVKEQEISNIILNLLQKNFPLTLLCKTG